MAVASWLRAWRPGELGPHARLGKYRLLRRLAVGGMAEIHLARADGWGGFEKLVVVKRLLPHYVDDPELVRMFVDEARLMAKLNHPNIAQVHDVGRARGNYFFAMEHVHGEDLRQIQRAAVDAAEPLPYELAIGVIAECAAGLHYAHERRADDGTPLAIVHRDVSPSNVLVSYDGAVKVTDFGVAKWADQRSETRHGTLKGKFAYMSPEQCRGEPLDRRSDVFALGILLYELSTGCRLYQGASEYAVLTEVASGRVPPPSSRRPGYPAALEAVVLRALAARPEQRFASARELQLALEALAHDAHLVTTAASRARMMERLFARKLAAWRAAEGAGRTLGQFLADGDAPTGDPAGAPRRSRTISSPLGHTRVTGAGVSAATPAPSAPRPRGRRVATAVALLALGVAVAFVALAPTTPEHTTSAATPAPPRPVAAAPTVEATPAPPDLAEPSPRRAPPPRAPHDRRAAAPRARATSARAPVTVAPAPAPARPARASDTVWDPDSVLLPR